MLGGELALALGRRSFAWKQADNSLVSRLFQFFFAHRKIPLRLSTVRKLKPQIDLSSPKSKFERTDDVGRQGSDAQQSFRTARSGVWALSRRHRACRQ